MPRPLQQQLNALSAKRMTKPGRHADGSGFYLHVANTGAKSWILRVTVKGKARTIGLGSALDVTLAKAREKAAYLCEIAKAGGDPIVERDGKDHDVPTFRGAAHRVHKEPCQAWKNEHHRLQRINSLRNAVNPVDAVRMALPKQPKKKKHHLALPYQEVAAFISDLRISRVDASIKLGFEFLILTACRRSY